MSFMVPDSCIVQPSAVVGAFPLRGYTARDPGMQYEVRIGARTAIGHHAVIYAGATIGADVLIGDGVKIREGVTIGARCRLHWDAQINYGATIGDDTTIGGGCHITGGMVVGARCFFGAGVMTANDAEPRQGYDPDRLRAPQVGDDCLIGVGAILLPGVRIGDGAIVGAGAIVAADVPPGATVAGAGRARRVASLGVCARCGQPLDNVAPGFSVTVDRQTVCTNCLGPGEELLRARGL